MSDQDHAVIHLVGNHVAGMQANSLTDFFWKRDLALAGNLTDMHGKTSFTLFILYSKDTINSPYCQTDIGGNEVAFFAKREGKPTRRRNEKESAVVM
jgi:hypothetical protein